MTSAPAFISKLIRPLYACAAISDNRVTAIASSWLATDDVRALELRTTPFDSGLTTSILTLHLRPLPSCSAIHLRHLSTFNLWSLNLAPFNLRALSLHLAAFKLWTLHLRSLHLATLKLRTLCLHLPTFELRPLHLRSLHLRHLSTFWPLRLLTHLRLLPLDLRPLGLRCLALFLALCLATASVAPSTFPLS